MDIVPKKRTIKLNSHENAMKQIRMALNLTQKKFSLLIGISANSVERYENGHRTPTLTLPQIKKLQVQLWRLGVDFCDLPDDWNIPQSRKMRIPRKNIDCKK